MGGINHEIEAEIVGRGFECIDLFNAIKAGDLRTTEDMLDWLDVRLAYIEQQLESQEKYLCEVVVVHGNETKH